MQLPERGIFILKGEKGNTIMVMLVARLLTAVFIFSLFTPVVHAANLFGPPGLDTTYGFQIRLRNELMQNMFELNTLPPTSPYSPDRDYFRLKTSAFIKFDYEKKYDFMFRLANEMKWYTDFAGSSYRSNDHYYDPDELLVDNLYVSAYNIFGLPLDMRVGRQDILLGDGFLVLEGTPGDGSRSIFFNAISGTVKFPGNHTLDLIYVSCPKTDMSLTWLYDSIYGRKKLNSSDEHGVIAYLHARMTKDLLVEPYFIYKREDSFGTVNGLDLNTYGARVVMNQAPWTLKGEFAIQRGSYDSNGVSREGYGGHAELQVRLDPVLFKPELEVGFVTLSGDDPATTDKVEAWDPLFSQVPAWSELFIYTLIPETGRYATTPAYWTNMRIYRAGAKFNFTPSTYLQLSYNYLRANEMTNISSAMFSNSGKDRGHLPQAKLYHKFNQNLDGLLLIEYFLPGNFYGPEAANALFVRAQLTFTL